MSAVRPVTIVNTLLACALAALATLSAPPGHARPASYQNPLALRLADGALAENCADPALLRDAHSVPPLWYLYCTTDPVSLAERDDSNPAAWKFRLMPVYRSADLVHWTAAGDAFSALPAVAAPKAGLWAPEPVYRNGRYYLYFTVTDVIDALSPEPGCDKDSAIAVATSASALGPWQVAGALVVAPRRATASGCDFHWTFDPEVAVDADGGAWLYYGSYGGGMFVQRLADDGLTTVGGPKRIGASGRYEGAEVVRHGGHWYLFASATDCCNGPLTGYAVFVGRAATPDGPFLDRLGNDMAAGRAGGTPFLTQNGNRWIGAGHNTVFADPAGQWWTIYHAIDRRQPWFSAKDRLTRRLALLDRIDWVDGWPVAAGPSDRPLPAPSTTTATTTAISTSTRTAPSTAASTPAAKAALLWRDRFRAPRLAQRWHWIRKDEGWRSSAAGLEAPTRKTDLHHDSNNAAVLAAALPAAGNYRIEARLQLDAPHDCCADPVQAGVVLYGDDDNYLKLVELAHRGLRQVEFAKETTPLARTDPRYGNTVVGTPGRQTWLRLDVERAGPGQDERYTAYSSQDGKTWVRGGSWTHRLGARVRLGLVAMGGAGHQATFAQVAVSRLR